MNYEQIKPNLPVECSDHGIFAYVEHMEGQEYIKLKKDQTGEHHFIPLKWVLKVDDRVHIDRPSSQAMREWSKTADSSASKGQVHDANRATNEGMKTSPPKVEKLKTSSEV